jgi:hypothetical protein
MKRIFQYVMLTAMTALCMTLASCVHDDNEVWHMWLINIVGGDVVAREATIPVGETLQLGLTIVPTFVNVVDPVWLSEDETVATVSSDGLVTALKEGETYITVHSAYNPEISDRLRLTVAGELVGISDDPVDQSEAEARRKR